MSIYVYFSGLITVRGYIEYNSIQTYNLTVQAVEVKSGLATTAVVIVTVQVSP
jgi:hypothetical protein